MNAQPEPQLSDRELECALLLRDGFQDKEIADVLKIAVSTVRAHVSRLYLKCGVRDRIGFAQWAYHFRLGRLAAVRLASLTR